MTKVAIAKPERRHSTLRRALAEPGRPLPEGLRTRLEGKFGADFRRVRIHTGSLADEAARSLNAEALTFGDHILFRAGAWRPETPGGLELLAHEAAHTLQHTGPLPDVDSARVSEPGDSVEREADAAVDGKAVPRPMAVAAVARRVAGIPPRKAEPADPARTIQEIGRTLLERVRADQQDRSGRVRNQLIRMEDNLRRDVLQWLERRMESHEWRSFLDLLAEPAPAGTEGTEDKQAKAAAPADTTETPAEVPKPEEESTSSATASEEKVAVPGETPAAGAAQAQAEEAPEEGAVAKPEIQGEAKDAAPPESTAGGAGSGPAPQPQAGAAPAPEAGPAPAEEAATSSGPAPGPAEAPAKDGGAPAADESESHAETAAEEAPAEQGEAGPQSAESAGAPPEIAQQTGETAETPTGREESAEAPAPTAETAAPPASEASAVSESAPPEAAAAPAPPESAPETEAGPPEASEIAEAPATSDVNPPGEIAQPEATGPAVESAAQPEAGDSVGGPAEGQASSAEAVEQPAGPPGAPPPAMLGEFAGEPSEDDSAPAGGGGGGGGAATPDAPPEEAAAQDVPAGDPVGAMQTIGAMKVGAAAQAMGAATASVSAQVGSQRGELESNPPTMERPTGSPQGAEGSTPGNVPVSPPGPNPAPLPPPVAGQPTPLAPVPAAPQPGAPVTQKVAPPQVTGTAQGQISESDARRVQDAVNNVPVTDEALHVTAGAAPELPLEGDADPEQAAKQQTTLLDSAATTQEQGAQEAAAPMGENHIYPKTEPGTIQPEAGACSCCGGGAGKSEAGGGAPDTGVAAVAEQERGEQVRESANGAAGKLTEKQQKQAEEQQKANTDSQKQVDDAVKENAKQQTDERSEARKQVQTSRREWTEGQKDAVDTARKDSTQAVSDAQTNVGKEQTKAQTQAAGHITDGNTKIEKARTDSEAKARAEREKSKREADGGILGWLASSITSFFSKLRDAIHSVFDAARRLVKTAIEAAQKLAHEVIDLARKAVVGLIKLAGKLLVAIGDTLLAAFPTLREKFRNAIEKVVNAAVSAVNALAAALERGIKALLGALLTALNAILCAYEMLYMAIVDTVASAVKGALDFARAAIAVFGAFASLVKDIAPNPGQWLRNLGASIMDGLKNHLWKALKTAVKNWFNETVESIIGVGKMLLDLLKKGGITLKKIAGFVWKAILSALPGIIVQFLIERLISLLIPAAAAILLLIQGLVAAWGAVQKVIQAFQLFFIFLKAVKGGNAGPQFATALAASAVAVIQFLAMFLIARLGKAAGGIASKFKALATKLMAFFKRAAKAVGKVLKKVGKVLLRGARAVGRLAKKGLKAVARVLRKTKIGRKILRGIRKVRVGIKKLGKRFRKWREKRRQNRQRRREDALAKAQRELPSKIGNLLARRPSRLALKAQLLYWRIAYHLKRLRIASAGDSYPIVAANSPEVEVAHGYSFPLHVVMRAIDEVADEVLKKQREFQRNRDAGPYAHLGETAGTGPGEDKPFGYFRSQAPPHYGTPVKEVVGIGRPTPAGKALEHRMELLQEGGVPRRGLSYSQIAERVSGEDVGNYFGGFLKGYGQHPPPASQSSREAIGSLFGLWFEHEHSHPRSTFGHRRDFAYSLMLTKLMQRGGGATPITPGEAIALHPAAFGGAQEGAKRTTRAMRSGRTLPEGAADPSWKPGRQKRWNAFQERIHREKQTLQAWFKANPVESNEAPTYEDIKASVRQKLTLMIPPMEED